MYSTWNLKIQENYSQIKGKRLNPPKVYDERNNKVDFEAYEKGTIKHTQPITLRGGQWTMVYSSYDFELTTTLFENMQRAQGRFGIKVEEPAWIELGKGQDRQA